MRELTDKEIIKATKKAFGHRSDDELKAMKDAGVPLIWLGTLLKEMARRSMALSDTTKKALRQRATDAKIASEAVGKAALKMLPFSGASIPSSDDGWIVWTNDKGAIEMRRYKETQAEALSRHSRDIMRLLRRHRKDHDEGIERLAGSILHHYPNFNRWMALRNLIEASIHSDDNPPDRTLNLSDDAVRLAAMRYVRRGPPLRRLTPAEMQSALKINRETWPMSEKGE